MTVQGIYQLLEPESNSIAYISVSFDGKKIDYDSRIVEQPKQEPEVGELTDLKILFPYCSAPYTARMETDFNYSMGSEWTGIYGEETTVKIYCDNCKKLIYTKED